MSQRRMKTYLLIAAFISGLLLLNLESPLNSWLSNSDIPGGHNEVEDPVVTYDDVMTNRYNFLYGKDFEEAIDKAAASPRKV